ncbi:hypothetical protein BB987_10475 [Photorhabdus temperata]|uniref:Uncharacterized protein n=1 Tax=Photorhabdus khanii NC19 TaxID=1004151 RepID=W3V1Y9_9GAMM|nr:contractile injection system tape measure protein [Photorhabdus khanii]ETS29951.1 hypothetical protein PTE_03281 [Photorhabdus khanii NC19]OHV54442.1 hypothetical protein BB987_10475 [Photorhabdus temperata]
MTSEPNLLNRITITISANNQQVAKKVLHGSLLNQANINNLFNTFFTKYPINQDIYLETLTLDLGEISLHNFNLLFPVRFNTTLNKALSQYQTNNREKKTDLKQSKPQKITNTSSLLYNNLIDLKNFIHYLNQENSISNSMEVIDNHQNIDINIQKLINQLAGSENQLALLLAKSCLSEPSLQRLLNLNQPDLLNAINHRLSDKINRLQYSGELVSPGQLILNALQYIQLNSTQGIPKLDAKVLLHITTALDGGTLNAASIITLFRQIIIHNIPLNSWLKQIWQTISVARLSKKHLSDKEYQYLSERFTANCTDKNRSDIELTTVHKNISKIQQEKYLPEHSISNHMDKNTLGKKLISTYHDNINTREEPYLSEYFTQNHTNRKQSSKQSVITDISGKITQENQYTSEHLVSVHADKNKSSKKLAFTHVDIQNIQQYQYSTNQKLISENHKISSTSNNLSVKDSQCSQFRTIRKIRPESTLLSGRILPYQVNNTGILILWPMLPALFNQLGLLEDQKFIHRQAQFSAVNFLNYLVWGNEEIQGERKIMNNVLCGLMVDEMIELTPIEPEKQLIINQWLDAVISQLPGWKKLSSNDVRQLFLQRPGELLISDQEIKITVEHQPFDVLLADWPWPLNIAKLPWLDRPLKIDWKNI